MHHTSLRISANDIAGILSEGGDFQGKLVDGGELWKALGNAPSPNGLLVRNAIIEALTVFNENHTSFPVALTFDRCTFFGDTRFRGCDFQGKLTLTHSTVEGNLKFEDCDFCHGLLLDTLDVHGQLVVVDIALDVPPSLVNSSFRSGTEIENFKPLEGKSWDSVDWQISECRFWKRVTIDGFPLGFHPSFHRCHFETGSFIQLSWEKTRVICALDGCLIAGRVVIKCIRDERRADLYDRTEGAEVTIQGCTISGMIDLRQLRLRYFDLRDTTFSGGRMWIDRQGLHNPCRDRDRMCKWAAADRIGVLRDEQSYSSPDDSSLLAPDELKPDSNTVACLHRIATQYEELRNSLETVPSTYWEQDFCHYKCMDFQRRHRIARLGMREIEEAKYPASLGLRHFRITLASLLGIIVLLLVGVLWRSRLVEASCFAGLGLVGGLLWQYSRTRQFAIVDVLREAADLIILKWLLAYGTHVRRVLGWAVVLMLAFAFLVYWPIVVWAPVLSPDFGGIQDPDNYCISMDRQTDPPVDASTPILLARVAYFSAVTFTTLGYGDYHPVGWVKLIAAAEAFMGAATIALVTVIFARRFIR